MPSWEQTRVTLATGDEETDRIGVFTAYVDGSTWNGWLVPWFTREEATKIADWTRVLHQRSYDPDAVEVVEWDDARAGFAVRSGDSSIDELVTGQYIDTIGTSLYDIGAQRWTWEPATLLGMADRSSR